MKTDKKGTCVYEKDIHVSHKGQSAATNREKGQGVTRTRAGAAPNKNGLARTLQYVAIFDVNLIGTRKDFFFPYN